MEISMECPVALDEENEAYQSAPSSPSAFQLPPFHEDCPINTLPPELLATIFVLAHPKHQSPQKVPFEVTLSHVSRFWRGVAHGTCALWTNVTIYSPRSMAWLPSYLERSGAHTSLDITIDAYRWDRLLTLNGKTARRAFARDITDEIVPRFDRVQSLTILCYQEFTLVTIQAYFGDVSAHNLRRYKAKFDRTIPRTRRFKGIELFIKGAPNIRFVNTGLPDCLPSPPSLLNLTTLFINLAQQTVNFLYPDLVEMLTAAQSLRCLSIADATTTLVSSWPTHLTDADFEMPNLESLRLLDHSLMAAKFLLSVSAPKLESLWLHCSLDNFSFLFDAPQMDSAAGRESKFAKLRYFTLPFDSLYLSVNFARIFPNITYLHLPYANFYRGDQFQAALIWHWPALHTLVLTMVRETKWQKLTKALVAALPLRRQANRPIDTLLVDRDFRQMLRNDVLLLSQQVNIVDINEHNYQESWWNKAEERDLE